MPGRVGFLRPDGVFRAAPYAAAAVVPAGTRLVLAAGACPLDAEGRTAAPGDAAGQAEVCVADARIALAAAGATLADVVFLRVLVATTSRAELAAVWSAVLAAFDGHEPPGTLSGTTVLGWPDQLVEVEVVAAVPDGPLIGGAAARP